jgi:RNA polymerase sigma factor (sigma-70 family)
MASGVRANGQPLQGATAKGRQNRGRRRCGSAPVYDGAGPFGPKISDGTNGLGAKGRLLYVVFMFPADGSNDYPADAGFATTHWSVVLAAGNANSPATTHALEDLCGAYWRPLYAYVRRCGYNVPDAQDLTQAFFARLLERNTLANLTPVGAKFRSFLLTALKNFLTHEWRKGRAAKRGGRAHIFSLDELDSENRATQEPADALTPDLLFHRRWAEIVLDRALKRLREEQGTGRRLQSFEVLVNCLTGAEGSQPYGELAQRLNLTTAAVKMAVHRLRKRYGQLLRDEVAQTVATASEVDEELRSLLAAFAA